jgi:hypothetical protein
MASSNDTVIIKFEAQGDKSLVTAIKALDRATKSMINTQASMADFQKKGFQATEKGKASYIRLKNTMLSYDKTLRDVTKDEQLLALAKKGDAVATMKLSRTVKKYTRNLDRNKKSIVGLQHDTRILGGAFSVLRSKLLLGSFAIMLVKGSIGKLVAAQGEQELSEKKLSASLGRRSKELLKFASRQQQVTAFGDEETITAMSLVGAYTDNEDAIKRVTIAAMDLASAKGMDLNTAIDLVSKSVFSSTNALSRYGVTIEGDIGSTERLTMATGNLAKMYGGQAQEQAKTMTKQLKSAGDASGDAAESLGRLLSPAIISMAKGWKGAAEAVTEYADTLRLSSTTLNGIVDTEEREAIILARIKRIKNTLNNLRKIGSLDAVTEADLLNRIAKKEEELALTRELNFWEFDEATKKKLKALDEEAKQLQKAEHELKSNIILIKEWGNELRNVKNLATDIDFVTSSMGQFKTQSIEAIEKQRQHNTQVAIFIANNRELAEELGLVKTKQEEMIDVSGQVLTAFSGASSAYSSFVQGTVTADINALKARDSYQNASMEQRQTMEEGVRKKHEKALKRAALLEKAQSIASATIGTSNAIVSALGAKPWTPANYALAAIVGGLGAVQVASIMATPTAYAKGGDFVTNKPEMIMVGEAGREHVTITPIDRPESRALKDGGGLTINIQGGIVDQSYVSNELIPAINKATSLGVTLA